MRNPLTGNYSKKEKEQMQFIHKCYQNHINSALSTSLEIDSNYNKPATTPKATSFDLQSWLPRIDNRLLHSEAKDIITNICSYQAERHRRLLRNGYLDDPINLFCEEFKEWCIILSGFDFTLEKLDFVEKRARYVQALERCEYFPQGATHITTFIGLLTSIKSTLDKKVIPLIKLEIANTCAKDDLNQLANHSKSALTYAVECLYYILRDTADTPTNFTFDHMLEPPEAYKGILGTKSGQYLQQLIQQHTEWRSSDNELAPEQGNLETTLFLSSEQSIKTTNPYMLNKAPSSQNQLNCILPTSLKTSDSGIDKYFRENEQALNLFIEIHAYLYELSRFILMIQRACRLAGAGGDLLVYGFAKDGINCLMSIFDFINNGIQTKLNKLIHITDKLHFQLVNERNLNRQWAKNYARFKIIYPILGEKLAGCQEYVAKMRKNANSLSLYERLRNVKNETELFFLDLNKYVAHLHSLGLPKIYNSAVTQIEEIKENKPLLLESASSYFSIEEVKEQAEESVKTISDNTSSIELANYDLEEKKADPVPSSSLYPAVLSHPNALISDESSTRCISPSYVNKHQPHIYLRVANEVVYLGYNKNKSSSNPNSSLFATELEIPISDQESLKELRKLILSELFSAKIILGSKNKNAFVLLLIHRLQPIFITPDKGWFNWFSSTNDRVRINTSYLTKQYIADSIQCIQGWLNMRTHLDFFGKDLDHNFADYITHVVKSDIAIQSIELQKNNLNPAASKAIFTAFTGLPCLTKLDLWKNQLGDSGAAILSESLPRYTKLTTLILNENKISEKGASKIAEAIATHPSLTDLDIGYNCIKDKGTSLISRALASNKVLTTLRIGNNQIGEEGANALLGLAIANPHIKRIVLSDNEMFSTNKLMKIQKTIQQNELALQEQQEFCKKHPVSFWQAPVNFLPDASLAEYEKDSAEKVDRLIHAAKNGDLQTIKDLAQSGTQLSAANSQGYNAFLAAAENNYVDVLNWLYTMEPELINSHDHLQQSALLTSAMHGNLAVMQWLRKKGVSLDQKDRDGKTPLIWSAILGKVDNVDWLLQMGAAVTLDKHGNSPAYYAEDNLEIQALLSKYNNRMPTEQPTSSHLGLFRFDAENRTLATPANNSNAESILLEEKKMEENLPSSLSL